MDNKLSMQNPASAEIQLSKLRVAIVHYWFVTKGGGERVVEALAEVFPQADLFTLVADRSTLGPVLRNRKMQTSFLQHLPLARKHHRHFVFLHPLALEQFDLSGYDLVISSESGPAKGVITSSRTCHICYCHSPMRSLWEMYPEHRRHMGPLVGTIFSLAAHYLRLWDYASAARVDYFIANSHCVASRIRKYYGRESTVIYPPVDSAALPSTDRGEHYLTIGRLVDYKRFDLAVSACTQLARPLKVIGVGPEMKALRRMAGPTVEFLGWVSDEELRENLAGCRALLFPGEEDFGMAAVEAQSFGRPVIAYGSGGALETVRGVWPDDKSGLENSTGMFFTEQSVSGLVNAILDFETVEGEFRPEIIREHSLQFKTESFKLSIADVVRSAYADFQGRGRAENVACLRRTAQARGK